MTKKSAGRRIGVFDAGIGGFPIAAELHRLDPGVEIVYLGDAARRPYGPREVGQVAQFSREAEQYFARAGCDLWVVACYTASVALMDSDRPAALPRVDMVAAARQSLGNRPNHRVALMATAATVASGVLPRVLPVEVTQALATEDLLRLAEADGGEDPDVLLREATAAVEALHPGTTTVLLACTDFTCILPTLKQAAPEVTFVDPVETAAEMALQTLAQVDPPPFETPPTHSLALTGPHDADVLATANRYALPFDHIEYVDLDHDQREDIA
jgi:glutamate racemase